MQIKGMIESSFRIKRFDSSKDKDFVKALKIYNDTIPVETKTDTNEIAFFLDLRESREREMYFFGLYYNEEVVGYVECAYLKRTKTIVIDYFTLRFDLNINGIFYPLFSLLQEYFSDNLIDFDYMLSEVSIRSLEEGIDQESYYNKKLLYAEDFRLIDSPYPQPKLGSNNFESNFELRLMIKSINSIGNLKAETFIAIVKDIYYNHYLDWYKTFMSNDEIDDYSKHIAEQMKTVYDNTKGLETLTLNACPSEFCDHFLSSNCYYSISTNHSTAGFATVRKKTKPLLWILGVPLVIVFAISFSFLTQKVLTIYQISSSEIAPFFTSISATITGVLALVISNKTKK